jgi:hypothetical protein
MENSRWSMEIYRRDFSISITRKGRKKEMSQSCGFNIKINYFDNITKNELEMICKKNKLGIFYDVEDNWIGYQKIFDVAFHLSDSFEYDTLTILDTWFIKKFDEPSFRLFEEKYYFLKEIATLFLDSKAETLEILLSSQAPNECDDYTIIETTINSFLYKIYEEIIKQSNIWAYGFPVLKIVINNDKLDFSQKI